MLGIGIERTRRYVDGRRQRHVEPHHVCRIESRLDATGAGTFVLTLFGGEPLLNLPVAYYLSERLWAASQARGVTMQINVITNGLLLTPEVVDRLLPFGLKGVKITLDGDRDTHNRMRPLRGGQGTFDKIIANVRKVSPKVRISIGGNFDESSADSYPALLDFLREQEFADNITKINFKPIIKAPEPEKPKGFIPLTVVSGSDKPLGGTCMTSAGAGGGIEIIGSEAGCGLLTGGGFLAVAFGFSP